MSSERIHGNWNEIRGMLKGQWAASRTTSWSARKEGATA